LRFLEGKLPILPTQEERILSGFAKWLLKTQLVDVNIILLAMAKFFLVLIKLSKSYFLLVDWAIFAQVEKLNGKLAQVKPCSQCEKYKTKVSTVED